MLMLHQQIRCAQINLETMTSHRRNLPVCIGDMCAMLCSACMWYRSRRSTIACTSYGAVKFTLKLRWKFSGTHSLIVMHIWDNFAEMHIILKMKIGIERNETNNTISKCWKIRISAKWLQLEWEIYYLQCNRERETSQICLYAHSGVFMHLWVTRISIKVQLRKDFLCYSNPFW